MFTVHRTEYQRGDNCTVRNHQRSIEGSNGVFKEGIISAYALRKLRPGERSFLKG